jgi:hypothetical protein
VRSGHCEGQGYLHQRLGHDVDWPVREDVSELRPGQPDRSSSINHLRPSLTLFELGLTQPSRFADVRVIRNGEEAIERPRERHHTAEDKQPAPALETEMTIHTIVDPGLEIAAEHARGIASGIEDGDPLGQFCSLQKNDTENGPTRLSPRGVYQLPMIVRTPTANGLSSIPITKRSANTSRTFRTAAKQNVTMDQSNSTVDIVGRADCITSQRHHSTWYLFIGAYCRSR